MAGIVKRINSFLQGIIYNRWVQIIVLVVLFAMPLLFYAREWCGDLDSYASPFQESYCTYLVEKKPVTNSVLLSFTQMFTLIILASNWNLTGGFTGYVDFGHAVFFGIGAFSTALLLGASRWEDWPALLSDWNFWPAMVVGGLSAAFFAVLIGSATLRLKGPYFSIAMLGTLVAVRELYRVFPNISGAGLGMNLPIILNRPFFYYLFLSLAVLVALLISWIRRTEFGASLVAIREDEIGAEMRGINTTLHKITAFCITAFLTGVVGGIWAYQNTFIDVNIVFNQARTIDMVMMSMLGGLGTVGGPIVGSAILYWLRDIVWANFLLFHQIFEGILLIVIVLFVPEGIMGIFGKESTGTSLSRILQAQLQKSQKESS
jgi:branched-chain amino acid transport system permease protein